MECFIYDWNVFKNAIFAFGMTQQGETVSLKIAFEPYCFILLPSQVCQEIYIRQLQNIIRAILPFNASPKQMVVVKRYRMYGTHMEPGSETQRKKFFFLKCYFSNKYAITNLVANIDKISEAFGHALHVHDDGANPTLQLVCMQNLLTCGWIKTGPIQVNEPQQTLCDQEYTVRWQNLEKVTNKINVPKLNIVSFDIECVSEDRTKFPNPKMPNDVCFQISLVFSNLESCGEKHLFTMGSNVVVQHCIVHCFNSEANLLVAFSKFLQQRQVQIILGYNIFMFDIPFLIERSKQLQCFEEFCTQSMFADHVSRVRDIKWSSSAYQTQHYTFLDSEGRVFIDLLPAIQKEYKLENYKLDTVAKHFLNESKEDLDVQSIFDCYYQFTPESLSLCGSYCVKDSILVAKLFNSLKLFYNLQGMANVCRVPIKTLLLYGQQIKVYSQIYQYCTSNGFTVEKPKYKLSVNEKYTGAYVFTPQPGIYEYVVPFDFASLYPTTVIAYNIDYSTLVDPSDPIDDSLCHVMEWSDHFDCNHAIKKMCCIPRRFRFLKHPKGILPQIIDNLLTARRETRQLLKTEQDNLSRVVLNQQQLAFKVSANSMYGITGVREGMLPLMPLAMCITYMGRTNVLRAADIICKDFGGKIVYGDTDSNYIIFPHIDTNQLYSYADETSRLVSKQFPNPIFLEFENTIYKKFLIFKKKKYVYQKLNSDMTLDAKLGKTGVLLVRRDTFEYLRSSYEETIHLLFSEKGRHINNVLDLMTSKFVSLLQRQVPLDQLFMTKSFNDFEGSAKDGRLGHYKVKMNEDGDNDEDASFYIKQLPAMCQLVHRMKTRGDFKLQGNRLEYIILKNTCSKLGDRVEHKDYFLNHQSELHVDYGHYLDMMIQPFDQILETVFGLKNYVKSFYSLYYTKRALLMNQINSLSNPIVHFQ